MDGYTPTARDPTCDGVTRYRVAALAVADQYIVDIADNDAPLVGPNLANRLLDQALLERLSVGLGLLVAVIYYRVDDLLRRHASEPDLRHEFVGVAQLKLLGSDLAEFSALDHPLVGEVPAVHLPLEKLASKLGAAGAFVGSDMSADPASGAGCVHEVQPVLRRLLLG